MTDHVKVEVPVVSEDETIYGISVLRTIRPLSFFVPKKNKNKVISVIVVRSGGD